MSSVDGIIRKRYEYRGIIQGVGFRPAVFRCAVTAGVSGFVQNRRSLVVAEAEGSPGAVSRFEEIFSNNVPSAARIDSIDAKEVPPLRGERGFSIRDSEDSEFLFPPIPPDLAICDRCREELLDSGNRRYLYPFITCTQCGPRYSIVADTPFDRKNTSMDRFVQCPDCSGEYSDPEDRRFHSQTNSCSVCGPGLFLSAAGRREPDKGNGLIRKVIQALRNGKITALQGIGGFHLAADPSRRDAVEKLRRDKERAAKPFALMVRDLETARSLCYLGGQDETLLTSPPHPIVILRAREGIPSFFQAVSDTGSLGIMLPYTPLHVLLFSHPEIEIPYTALIMTSGNRHNEPIITDPEEAMEKLGKTADLFLYHDRPILMYSDDSVIRSGISGDPEEETCIIRRSRGFVPDILTLPRQVEAPVLAVGGDLKNIPAYADKATAYLGPYTGDLEEPLSMEGFERTVKRIMELYKIKPERAACDLHPGYYSREWAVSRNISEKVYVQHHHAHILSVMAEHGLNEAIGVSFDGTGYGPDETIWGGEFLLANRCGFTRYGCIRPFRLPGAEAAIKHPRRIAYSLLLDALTREDDNSCTEAGNSAELCGFAKPELKQEFSLVRRILSGNINSPLTSSAGRLFDCVASILGVVEEVGYEGEGPIKLEWEAIQYLHRGGAEAGRLHVETADMSAPDIEVVKTNGGRGEPKFFLDPGKLLLFIARSSGTEAAIGARAGPGALSYLFHGKLAEAVVEGVRLIAGETGEKKLCLSGGVFQNMLLRHLLRNLLREGLREVDVFFNRRVSPGDGGLSLGQAYFTTDENTLER